jgi:hypothetical protein
MRDTIFDPFLYQPALLKPPGADRELRARLSRRPQTTRGITAGMGSPGVRPILTPRARAGGRAHVLGAKGGKPR